MAKQMTMQTPDLSAAADDVITIADVKQFIVNGKKKKEDFISVADKSWAEVEKKNKLGKLFGGTDLERAKKWIKFPLWWSCWKIRQPITFARLAIPVITDTQGDDPYGRTACIIGERIAKGVLKTFDAYSEFSAGVDDFLVTNAGWGRWCYKSTEIQEEEKIRLQVIQPPPPQEPPAQENVEPGQEPAAQEQVEPMQPQEPRYLTPDGQEVDPSMVLQDDLGPYFATGQMVNVDDEMVYFEACLYSNLIIEPEAVRWNKVTRLAIEQPYGYREFKEKFGRKAIDTLATADVQDYKDGKKPITVYEYHDKILKETRWLTLESEDFFAPDTQHAQIEEKAEGEGGEKYGETNYSDLYGLVDFFPLVEPMLINQSTRSFWPTPEYFQVMDILDDISSIVTRMMQLTKAIRIRFLYDSSVKALAPLIGENWAHGEGTGMGVPNLEESLMNKNGSLSNLVAYFPIDELVKGLQGMYIAYDQRLNMFYNITGFSDLIRGQTSDSDKTYGERQLEGKFALNRMEPYQQKVQEWIKKNYQLGLEMALKLFSDKTIDEYVTPQTLDPEDKQRYVAALELLKNNRRSRFRVNFETDSTISINREWKRKQAIDTANAITKMLESTAQTAQNMPELADAELRIMKHVVGELTDGKLFMDEIADAIQNTIDKVKEQQQQAPAPDIEMEKLKLQTQVEGQKAQLEMRRLEFEEQKAMTEDRLTQVQMQMTQSLEQAKLEQKSMIDQFSMQLEQIKMQNDAGQSSTELSLKAQKLQSDIALAQEEITNKRNEFLLTAKDLADKSQLKQLEMMFDQRVQDEKLRLENTYAEITKQKVILDEREKYATEQRLQSEHQLQALTSMADLHKTLAELKTSPTPVVVHLQQPEGKKTKRVGKIVRDATGNPTHLEISDGEA